jgi:CRISPR/Cas system-associated protein Cas5 (RAMP superfamily)
MQQKDIRFPIVKLPSDVQYSLYLIKEELKSRKFFNMLNEAGLCDCYFQPHLDSLILLSVGLDDDTDETFNIYFDIIEKRSRKIEADNDSIMKQAFKVYQELVNEKKKRSAKKK